MNSSSASTSRASLGRISNGHTSGRCNFGHDYTYHPFEDCHSCAVMNASYNMNRSVEINRHMPQTVSHRRIINIPRYNSQRVEVPAPITSLVFPHLPYFEVQKVGVIS